MSSFRSPVMCLAMRALLLTLLAALATSERLTSQLPLIVKSPYMNSWITSKDMDSSAGAWPTFWTGHILGWVARIRVDSITYEWTGGITSSRPNITATYLTPTRTIFAIQAGPVALNATYLSPIDPTDLVRQSLPFGYFYIDAWSLDGKSHSVQFYSDITGESLSNDVGDQVQWNTTQPGDIQCHRMHLASMTPMQETGDMTKDGTLFFPMENRPGLTWQTGGAEALRGAFQNGSALSNSPDTDFRSIDGTTPANSGNINPKASTDWPALAFRVDLGDITQTDSPVVWALGVVRDPVVQYSTSGSIQTRSSYYWSAYNTGDDIIKDVIGKFDDVKSKAIDLDNKIMADGGAISSNYNDLVSLSLRVVFGGMDITSPRLPNGVLNTNDVKIFMKDIGSSSRVTPVETLYAAFPAILYLNSSLAGPILEPLLEYQNSSNYKNMYAAPDLGISYPKIQGNNSDTTELALENCGNMLIMTLAHASKSGDGSLIDRYYDMLKGWADYLGANTLHPAGYMDADGESTPNLSNLALKGIMGIYAMGKISGAVGRSQNDTSHYQDLAASYARQWQSLAISSGHITSVYGDTSSWGLIYNLYAAKLLGSDLFSDDIYTQQSQFYASQLQSAPKFGFPYDTNNIGQAKSHWTMFTAATVPDPSVRDSLLGMVWQKATINDTTPFPTTYDPKAGAAISGTSSPAQGAMFAPLTLSLSNKPITGFSSNKSLSKSKNIGAIAGGAVGGVMGMLFLLGAVALIWRRRRQRQKKANEDLDLDSIGALEPFYQLSVETEGDNIPIPSSSSAIALGQPLMGQPLSKGALTLRYEPSYGNSSEGGATTAASSSNAINKSAVSSPDSHLHVEMVRLRREMDELRSQRLQDTEPPPLYDFGDDVSVGASTDAGIGIGMGASGGADTGAQRRNEKSRNL